MSRALALDTISLKPTNRLAHTDYSLEYHTEYIFKKTGLRADQPNALRKYYDACHMDFLFYTNDGLYGDWEKFGRSTDMGHAIYAEDGSDMRMTRPCPFNTADEVWAFDAVAEYGLPSFDEQVKAYEQITARNRQLYPNQLTTGGYYKTIMSGAIQAFGWEMLLIGASNPSKMEKVLDGFYRRTKFHMEAWAKTSAEVIIQHDDFVWTSGPFLKPDYYRQVIIPRYKELWKPLHSAGKKVLFISDGNYTEFAEDIVEAGADGLIFEPCMDFGYMADRFGSSAALIGSYVDCRDLTFNKWEKVKADMDRTFEAAKRCKGLIFAVGNHLPANISDEMLDLYLDYFVEHMYK
jgi:hypothetical protein